MKRGKDEDKDDVVVGSVAVNNNNNNNSKLNNTASPNISSGSNSNDANNGSGNTPGTVRTTGRVKKPKQVYDPSDNYISRGSRNSLPAPAAPQAQPPSPAQSSCTMQQQLQQNPQTTLIDAMEVSPQKSANTSAKEEPIEAVSMPSAEQLRNFDTCMKCGKSEAKRGSGYKSNFLTCKACTLKWHFTCLPITFETLTNARKKYKCEKCRRCRICMTSKGGESNKELLMCCACANVYHLDCHCPRVIRAKLSDRKWKCYSCDPNYNQLETDDDVVTVQADSPPRKSKAGRKKRATSDPAVVVAKKLASNHMLNKNGNVEDFSSAIKIANISAGAVTTRPDNENSQPTNDMSKAPQCLSPSSPGSVVDLSSSIEDKENGENRSTDATDVPECSQHSVQNWSVDEVVGYMEKFYPRDAGIFKTQEIDGAALMVLTRQDIIDRFGLKLGPALRIYELVLGLQSSLDDVALAWCD